MERQGYLDRPLRLSLVGASLPARYNHFSQNKHNRADILGGAELLIINQAYEYDMALEWQERLVNNRVET